MAARIYDDVAGLDAQAATVRGGLIRRGLIFGEARGELASPRRLAQ